VHTLVHTQNENKNKKTEQDCVFGKGARGVAGRRTLASTTDDRCTEATQGRAQGVFISSLSRSLALSLSRSLSLIHAHTYRERERERESEREREVREEMVNSLQQLHAANRMCSLTNVLY